MCGYVRMMTFSVLSKMRTFYWLELAEFILAGSAFFLTDANFESLMIGGVISLLGAAIFTWAGGYRNKEGDGHLTFGGPYRFVRYPLVLSRFMMLVGLIIIARRPILFLLALVLLTPVYRDLTRKEDEWLQGELGPGAAEYRALVSGFIPQFLPARLIDIGKARPALSFSWTRSLWNRPGRAALVITGVAFSILGQYILADRVLLDWQWRLGAALAVVLGGAFIFRDIARPRYR